MQKWERKRYSYNALLLVFSTFVVKVVSVLYKIPLTSLIGATGRGYFGIAYNLYIPVIALCIGGLPVALTKMISGEIAKNNFEKIKAIKKVSKRLFLLIGIIGTAFLFLFAKFYSNNIAKEPMAFYSIIMLAPSILFSCLGAAKRGVFEGFSNMIPTAVSQLIEALFKSVFGLLFARFVMSKLYNEFLITGLVLGKSASSNSEALSHIFPFTAAASLAGTTIGAVLGWLFLEIYSLSKSNKLPYGAKYKGDNVTKELISIATPIIAACFVQSILNLADTTSIQYCLNSIPTADLQNQYKKSIELSSTLPNDVSTYIYGIYNTVLDFKNLVPMLTGAVGVAFLPVISGAFTVKDKERLNELSNLFVKYSAVIGSGIGFGMAAMPKEIIIMLFGKDNLDIALASEKSMIWFGLSMIIFALMGPVVYAVQAIGCAKKSIATFIVGGAVRIAINCLLVADVKYNIFGAVISSALSALIITVWNFAIYTKYTGTKINWYQSLIKPLLLGISVYFVADYINIKLNIMDYSRFFIAIPIAVTGLYYLICLLLFKILDLSKIKSYKSVKNS